MDIEELKRSHEAVYICEHVFHGSKPVLYLCKEDNEFQFLCGGMHSVDAIPHVVGLGHLLSKDDSLISIIVDLKDGFEAERESVEGIWKISKLS